MTGTVEGIYIADEAAGPLRSLTEVRAVAGQGLEGDRYSTGRGSFSKKPRPDRQVTLVEAEAIEAVSRDYDIPLTAGQSRRNIVTRGTALNHLVGRVFTIGEAQLRGVKLCEPCGHLESLTRPGVRAALIHRGGLRAEIVGTGVIRIGDAVG